MKDYGKSLFSLRPGMILFYDKRTRAFMSGEDIMSTYHWHSGETDSDDKMIFQGELSFEDTVAIAQIAANAAGLEINTDDRGNITVFTLRLPQ